jgi:AraC-like DNA-binding protein
VAVLLDTVGIGPRHRADAIAAALVDASAPCHVLHEDPAGPLHARMQAWELGGISAIDIVSSGIRLFRTRRQVSSDETPLIALSVQQREARFDQAELREVVPAGELLLNDLSQPYDFAWSGDGGAACVQIPAERLGLPIDVIRRAGAGLRQSSLYPLVASHIARLTRDAARLSTDPSAPAVGAASIELVRALLASAAFDERQTRSVLAETLLTRIRTYVGQHLADPDLRPATIAAAHNVSLRYLYKVCADAEFSLEQWIIAERLRGAREELARPASGHQSIAVIANRWGFSDPTHFGRRFRAAYGLAPRDWRRAAQAEPKSP